MPYNFKISFFQSRKIVFVLQYDICIYQISMNWKYMNNVEKTLLKFELSELDNHWKIF